MKSLAWNFLHSLPFSRFQAQIFSFAPVMSNGSSVSSEQKALMSDMFYLRVKLDVLDITSVSTIGQKYQI
jgi:hypothetical protein